MGPQDLRLLDDFLIERSDSSFRKLYRAYTPRLYQTAYRLSGRDVNLTDELVQDTWVRAIRKLDEFKRKSSLLTFLTGILINVNREKFRKVVRESVMEELVREDPRSNVENKIREMDLEAAIESLPHGYRQILILHDVEGFTHKDIAEMLEINEGTSKSQLCHARKAMRKFLVEKV